MRRSLYNRNLEREEHGDNRTDYDGRGLYCTTCGQIYDPGNCRLRGPCRLENQWEAEKRLSNRAGGTPE